MIVGRYLWRILISLDQLANTLLGGDPDETVSSRLSRAMDRGSRVGAVGCAILDRLDPKHCERAKGV